MEIPKEDLELYLVTQKSTGALDFIAVPPALKDLQIRVVHGSDTNAVTVIREMIAAGKLVKIW